MNQTLLIATHNKAKFEQIKQILGNINYHIVSLQDLHITHKVNEIGLSYKENAILKARTYARLSGIATLADDSGLEVDALDGAPGIYSARFAGEDKTDQEKVAFLLDTLKNIPEAKRGACFKSVVAYITPDNALKTFNGLSKGFIAFAPRGPWRAGFPYLSVYIPEGFDKTVNELEELNIEYPYHRKQALKELKEYLLGKPVIT